MKVSLKLPLFGLVLLGMVFAGANLSAQQGRGMGIPPKALPDSLKALIIEDHFISAPLEGVGVIHALEGVVVVIHQGTGRAYFGREGDQIYEHDALHTLSDSRCRLRLENEDVIGLAPETQFSVDEYSTREAEGEKSSFFSMIKGKAMFYAMRLFRLRKLRCRVKTPTAVVGVRGTKFGVHVYWIDGESAGSRGVRVAGKGRSPGPLLARSGDGTAVTIAACGDGSLAVNGTVLGPGEYYNSYTGAIGYDPGVLGGIEGSSRIGEPRVGQDSNAGVRAFGTEGGGGGGEGAGLKGAGDMMEEQTDTTDTQRASPGSPGSPETPASPDSDAPVEGAVAGEVVAAAVLIREGAACVWYPYQSDDPPLDSGGTHHLYEMGFAGDDRYRLTLEETSSVEVTYFDHNTGEGNIHVGNIFDWHEQGGYGDYLTWGYWSDPSKDTPPPPPTTCKGEVGKASFDAFLAQENKIWGLRADRTHPDYIDHLEAQTAVFHYSGTANGAYANQAGNTATLDGSFSCDVDFGAREVSGFEIDVDAPGTGAFRVDLNDGSGTIEQDGDFDVSFTDGTMGGGSIDPAKSGAEGGFAGSEAEAVGALWYATDSADQAWAIGEAHGKR